MTVIYSIGYGNRPWDQTLELLKRYACQFLIDVRSSPYSKFSPSYNRETIDTLCTSAAIRYVFMGDSLGGKPAGDSRLFDEEGKVDYVKVAKTERFQVGLKRLEAANQKGLVSFLMCSELKPEMCHRCKLLGMALAQVGIEVVHIDEKGAEVSQEQAISRLTRHVWRESDIK
jgi:uncharacterized protein (DUF488 family)